MELGDLLHPLWPVTEHGLLRESAANQSTGRESEREDGRVSMYVFVHGAWHGKWCWDKVIPELELQGHKGLAIDLPGHGNDRTSIADVTLDSYVDRVCQAINIASEPVVLVGHSMGGGVISRAAELHPRESTSWCMWPGFFRKMVKRWLKSLPGTRAA